ncbi:MAG TPA: hypothetical protein VIJ94_00960 [Caulobacteraceae bacterium]
MRIEKFGHCRGGELVWAFYEETGEIAVRVVWNDGTPEATLTVCPPLGTRLAGPHEIWVKSWSENQGAGLAVIRDGIADATEVHCQCGYSVAGLYQLTPEAVAEMQDAFRRDPDMATAQEQARHKAEARHGLSS